ncbi:MAG TPA: hypothetical protein VJ732_10305, partial [Bryobacteraceae bacterium]|nr:hypothetical protein [Bryobacteraceae bacterium]
SGFRRTAESDPAGAYSISSLEPGIYKIMVHREGFRDVIQFDVRLAAAASTRADFTLRIGRLGETITVEGFTPLIEQDSAATGGRFDSDEIQRLPLNGRGLLTLLELIPGTNVTPATRGEPGQFTTTGQRPNTNYFTIDGITGNLGVTAGGVPAQFSGGAMPALSAFGSLDSLISLEAVEEFRVQTSTEVAEFGRLPGASVSLTSRSGSNQLHGATSYRVRNEFLGANDWFGNQAGYGRLPLRMQDVTQSVGGPLWRNHTFFFLDYERSALTQPYVWVQPVPTVQLRGSAPAWAQPALNLFPLPNDVNQTGTVANWAGRVTRPAGLQTGAARLDQTLSRRVNLFLRYNDSPSYSEFGSIQINQLDFRFQSLTLGVTAHPTANLTLDSRLNGSKAGAHSVWSEQPGPPGCELVSLVISFGNAPNPCAYLTRFQISGIAQLEAGREGDRRQGQFQVIETGAWRHGGHSITLGADYRDILAVRRDAGPTLSVIAEDLATLADRNSFLTSTAPRQWLSANVRELSLWAQDTWQARPWLTVSAGLRWEYSPAPLSDPTTNFLDPASGTLVTPVQPQPLWRDSTRYFAPRLGVALRLNKSGRTVLRAGGGLYYDSSLSIATDLLNNGPLSVSEYRGSLGIFPVALTFGLLPDLSLPEVRQWNVSLEQAIGSHDMVSLGYVGSEGRFLIRRELGGPANTSTDRVALTTNHGASSYDALQIEYRHRVARGLQAVASYAWSHALD